MAKRSAIAAWIILFPLVLHAEDAALAGDPTKRGYELIVQGELLSLQAADSPLIHVLHDVGSRLGFEVDADIGEEVKLTTRFRDRPLDEAIRKMCGSIGYLVVRHPEDGRIRRLILTPKKTRATRTAARQADPPGWKPRVPLSIDPVPAQPEKDPAEDEPGEDPNDPGDGPAGKRKGD